MKRQGSTTKHEHKFDALVKTDDDDLSMPFGITVRCRCGVIATIVKKAGDEWKLVRFEPPRDPGKERPADLPPIPEPATVRLARELISSSWESITQSSEALKDAAEKALTADGYTPK